MQRPPDLPAVLRRTAWRELLVAQALATLEAQAPLDDAPELAAVRGLAGSDERRIRERAWRLAQRSGLLGQLGELLRRAWWPLLACAGLVALSSWGILQAVVGEGRRINLVLAFWSVLGLHLAALALWLVSLASSGRGGSGMGRWVLGLIGGRVSREKAALLGAATELLQRAGLTPWVFGLFSHLVWAAAFVLVLAGLLAAFAFNAFQLSWETTILRADFFVAFITRVGWLPAQLGFPAVAEIAAGMAGGAAPAGEHHRLLAWWLIGCTASYGLLPRLLLAALCAAVCVGRARRLRLDPTAPWVRRLATRLAPRAPGVVVDAEQPVAAAPVPPRVRPAGEERLALVGFELPPEAPWPPPGLVLSPQLDRRIEGGEQERQALLDELAAAGITQVLLVLDGAASPDRGTARFVQALTAGDRLLALLLVGDASRRQPARWVRWCADIERGDMPVLESAEAAQRWAGAVHG